jgi:hypothetical protein
MNSLIRNQKVQKGQLKERVKISRSMQASYAKACTAYNVRISDFGDINEEIAELLSRINSKLPDNQPDTNPNEIEFILKTLYRKSELLTYYTLAKEHSFDLKEIIYEWIKKLILLIHNIK